MILRMQSFGLVAIFLGPAVATGQEAADDKASVPPVQMTEQHRKLVHVKEGEPFPNLKLPRVADEPIEFNKLRGKAATVVVIWSDDHWMTQAALTDLAKDVPRLFGKKPVSMVGIAVNQTSEAAQATLAKHQVQFPHLVDADGEAVKQVTEAALPNIFAVGPDGKVAWFDIEYSEASRRELRQTIEALTAE